MTELTGDQQNVEEMSINDLRKLATSYGIKASRDWVSEDFIEAINQRRQRHSAVADVVLDPNKGPAPGKARIKIHNSQTGSNHPIPVSVNNYFALIPRDVEVDVPLEVLESLRNSKTPVRAKDPTGRLTADGKPAMVWKDVQSYPFDVLAMTPGVAMKNGVPMVRSSSNRAKHALKLKFREIYQRWPKRAEFKTFMDHQMKVMAERSMKEDEKQGD